MKFKAEGNYGLSLKYGLWHQLDNEIIYASVYAVCVCMYVHMYVCITLCVLNVYMYVYMFDVTKENTYKLSPKDTNLLKQT